jgi:hypothetical protein
VLLEEAPDSSGESRQRERTSLKALGALCVDFGSTRPSE